MANKRILINISDPVTEALIKSQNKRIAILEKLIKQKRRKKEDALMELKELNTLRNRIDTKFSNMDKKTSSLLTAIKESNTPKPFKAMVVPSPS